ncbi:MAG: hypothetical protein EXX96DRAFT_566577 [Benjaminiella poitrasii]|nr:MAG: hypothetical protein EXX96DRAFT_566577 [Benjaminiella poitrasii]
METRPQASIPHENDPLETDMNRSLMNFNLYITSSFSRNSTDVPESSTASQANKPVQNAQVQKQRWDAFFEPQYSFGSFIHGSTEPLGNGDEHKKNVDRLIDDGNRMLDYTKSPRPALGDARPSIGHGSGTSTMLGTVSSGIMTPKIPFLVKDASQQARVPLDEERLRERLELLKMIRMEPGGLDAVDTVDDSDPSPEGAAEKLTEIIIYNPALGWKEQLVKKARQWRKEVEEEEENISVNSSKLSSLDPDDVEKKTRMGEEEQEQQPVKNKSWLGYRSSFLYFLFGFVFPPIWLLGAFYMSSHANRQTSASRRIDRLWSRRSRIAFCVFAASILSILIVLFLLNPKSIGWRFSRQQ